MEDLLDPKDPRVSARSWRRARPWACLAAALLFIGGSAVLTLVERVRGGGEREGGDKVTRSERRFSALVRRPPPRRLCVFSDDPRRALNDFLLAQYSLAPTLLRRATDCRLVLGVFGNTYSNIEEYVHKDFELLKDYGQGVYLFGKRRARP